MSKLKESWIKITAMRVPHKISAKMLLCRHQIEISEKKNTGPCPGGYLLFCVKFHQNRPRRLGFRAVTHTRTHLHTDNLGQFEHTVVSALAHVKSVHGPHYCTL